MKAITTCVDFGDLLALTLPHNATHFDSVLVVTTWEDRETQRVVDKVPNADCLLTDAFHRGGDPFNKGRALDEALWLFPRRGWITVMDADILLPLDVDFSDFVPGCLYSPYRRLCGCPEDAKHFKDWTTYPEGPERCNGEFAGALQCFRLEDPVLLPTVQFYGCDHPTAQGVDTAFWGRWPRSKLCRPLWEVLHLGPTRVNWSGRVTPRWEPQP